MSSVASDIQLSSLWVWLGQPESSRFHLYNGFRGRIHPALNSSTEQVCEERWHTWEGDRE
ncbi:hypothetical protein KIL84_005006, partial [Mauremys mutica]